MGILADILREVLGQALSACKEEIANATQRAGDQVRCVLTGAGLTLAGVILLLWTLGLLVAALVVGLAPHLGTHWALMIGAGGTLLASATFFVIAKSLR